VREGRREGRGNRTYSVEGLERSWLGAAIGEVPFPELAVGVGWEQRLVVAGWRWPSATPRVVVKSVRVVKSASRTTARSTLGRHFHRFSWPFSAFSADLRTCFEEYTLGRDEFRAFSCLAARPLPPFFPFLPPPPPPPPPVERAKSSS